MEETGTPAYLSAWSERVGGFASAVGKDIGEVAKALEDVIGEPSGDALNILADEVAAPDAEIKEALKALKIPSGKINMHLGKLRGPKVEAAPAMVSATAMQALSILPQVPDETSFIEMLKTGGVLKVDVTEVLSAVKAALAKRVGLYEFPDLLLDKMEAFAEAQEEPSGEAFYRLQRVLTERRYGDVLSALGVAGSYVSERRKKDFFVRLEAKLWGALESFQKQLTAWQQAWMQGMANPGMLMVAMTAGHVGGVLPPGMMVPPDTAPLRTAGEEVVNEINRVFAGPGIPVARALAYDATRIMGILNDPSLPGQVGAGTKDQMLKELGITVGADIVRTEQAITRYCLAIMSLPKVTADVELAYFAALIQLGSTILWDKLAGSASVAPSGRAGLGKRERDL